MTKKSQNNFSIFFRTRKKHSRNISHTPRCPLSHTFSYAAAAAAAECCGDLFRTGTERRNRNCDDGCDFGLGRNTRAYTRERVTGNTDRQREISGVRDFATAHVCSWFRTKQSTQKYRNTAAAVVLPKQVRSNNKLSQREWRAPERENERERVALVKSIIIKTNAKQVRARAQHD